MRKNNTDLVEKTLKLLDRIPEIFNTTRRNTLKNRQRRVGQPLKRQIFSFMFSLMICMSTAAPFVPVAAASGGSYTLKWSAADPEVGKAPYLPTYEKLTTAQLVCPGNAGRYPDPLKDAVAYGPTNSSSDLDAVASLALKCMALGQIVPFEVEINVDGSTSPENGTINFTAEWLTKTTAGNDFGYDPAYMVYCAFVDTADAGTYDPGENAKVDSFTSTLVNLGTSNEAIQGTFTVSGLDDGDKVIVEIWVVLKDQIPERATGNVQTSLVSAQTATNDTIRTGQKTIPLLRVQEFFSADADISVTKNDSPDPVTQGDQLTYSLIVTSNGPAVANNVVVTDTLDANTNFVSASGATYTISGNTITFTVGSLSPGESMTLTIVTTVSDTAPTENDISTNPEAGSATPPTILYDLLNFVSVTVITDDPTPANNTYYQPTNVLSAFLPNPSYTIDKIVTDVAGNGPTGNVTKAGDVISYQINVTNTGNVDLTNVSVTDPLIGNLTGPIESINSNEILEVGETWTYTGTYTVTQQDINSNGDGDGDIDNTATVDSEELPPQEDSEEVPIQQNASYTGVYTL